MTWIFGIVLLVLVVWGIEGTASGFKERVAKKEWGRLWIAGIALAVTVVGVLILAE